jgi:hypothetical protein
MRRTDMEFVIGALTMLFGVLVGAAILSTTLAKVAPSRKDVDHAIATIEKNEVK